MKRILALLAIGLAGGALLAATLPTAAPVHSGISQGDKLGYIADNTQMSATGSGVATLPVAAPTHKGMSQGELLGYIADYTQDIAENGAGGDIYYRVTGTVGDGVTDDTAAIRAALDAASALGVARSRWVTVVLDYSKVYKLVPTLFTPTSGSAKYGCIPMPPYVDLDINSSLLLAYYTGADATIGAIIFPKGLHTNTSNYGAASHWRIRNGSIAVFDQTEERTANSIVFAQCEDVHVEDITVGGRNAHALEIQAGKGFYVSNVVIESPTNTVGHPDIQFDYSGDAGAPTNAAFSPTCAMEDMEFRNVKISGFHPYTVSGPFRRIEFGHTTTKHVVKNVLFENCSFDGVRGPTSGAVASDRHILDFNTHSTSGNYELENCIIRGCHFFHDVAGGSDSACIAMLSGGFVNVNHVLVEDCEFTGTFTHAVIFGSANGASPQDRHPALRRNLVARNNRVKMGTWSTPTSGGTYGPQPGGTESGTALCAGFSAGSCANVILENNLVIEPNALATGHYMSRTFRGYHIANNYSTIMRNNRVEFWHRYSAASPAYGVFTGLSVDCDEIVNTLGLPCHFVCEGFQIDSRMLEGVIGTASTDVFTKTGHWLVNGDIVRLDFGSGLAGSPNFDKVTSYYVVTATANTFQLSTTLGGAAKTFTTDCGNMTVRLAHNWGVGYSEEALTAAAASESRLTGYRSGIAAYVTNYSGANDILLEMPLGDERAVQAAGTTTTPVTQNTRNGSVNMASGATTHVINNSMVSATSIIKLTIMTAGTSTTSVVAVPTANQFTITANAAPGAECRVAWELE